MQSVCMCPHHVCYSNRSPMHQTIPICIGWCRIYGNRYRARCAPICWSNHFHRKTCASTMCAGRVSVAARIWNRHARRVAIIMRTSRTFNCAFCSNATRHCANTFWARRPSTRRCTSTCTLTVSRMATTTHTIWPNWLMRAPDSMTTTRAVRDCQNRHSQFYRAFSPQPHSRRIWRTPAPCRWRVWTQSQRCPLYNRRHR